MFPQGEEIGFDPDGDCLQLSGTAILRTHHANLRCQRPREARG
jgi:hypothetical protein